MISSLCMILQRQSPNKKQQTTRHKYCLERNPITNIVNDLLAIGRSACFITVNECVLAGFDGLKPENIGFNHGYIPVNFR